MSSWHTASQPSSTRPSWIGFFRISNGNTQVSATELRAMPLPAESDIRSIGVEAQARMDFGSDLSDLDALVARTLNLSPDLRMGLELAAR